MHISKVKYIKTIIKSNFSYYFYRNSSLSVATTQSKAGVK